MALDRILQITRSKSGWLASSKDGAPSKLLSRCVIMRCLATCRCTAHPKNLDAPGAQRRTQAVTDYALSVWKPVVLWTDYGIRADVIVSNIMSYIIVHLTLFDSLSPMGFLAPTSMTFSHRTYFTKSSKARLRTIWSCGLTNIYTRSTEKHEPTQLLRISIIGAFPFRSSIFLFNVNVNFKDFRCAPLPRTTPLP